MNFVGTQMPNILGNWQHNHLRKLSGAFSHLFWQSKEKKNKSGTSTQGLCTWSSGPLFNIKMSSYQRRKFHCGDKMVVRSSYLHNGISCTGKIISLYWIRAQVHALLCFVVTWQLWILPISLRITYITCTGSYIRLPQAAILIQGWF